MSHLLIVDGDSTGAGLAAHAEAVNENLAREYARLPEHVPKRMAEIDRHLAGKVIARQDPGAAMGTS